MLAGLEVGLALVISAVVLVSGTGSDLVAPVAS